MGEYVVIEKGPCPACEGRGTHIEKDRPTFTWETICLDCDGLGTRTREVPLAEALAALAGPGRPWREWARDTARVLETARVARPSTLEDGFAEMDRLLAKGPAAKVAGESAAEAPARTRRSVSGEEIESERPGWEWHRSRMRAQGVPEADLPSLVEWTQYRWALAGMKSGGCPPEGLPSFAEWRAETEDTP